MVLHHDVLILTHNQYYDAQIHKHVTITRKRLKMMGVVISEFCAAITPINAKRKIVLQIIMLLLHDVENKKYCDVQIMLHVIITHKLTKKTGVVK